MSSKSSVPNPNDTNFKTKWDVVNRAKSGGEDLDTANALNELCSIYRHPIYVALRYKHHFDHHDAEDLAQSFITWIIHNKFLERADPQKGRFRSFLLSYLDNYVANHRRRLQAQKRGGNAIHVPAEFPTESNRTAVEPKDENTPAKEFDRAWAVATFRMALDKLRAKYLSAGKDQEFETLQSFLFRERGEGQTYESAASQLGISEVSMRQRVSRFGRKFRLTIEEVVRPMVPENEFQDEINHLWKSFER